MKTLTMFYLEVCPYCKRAFRYLEELKAENPVYAKIPIQLIEERQQKELADSYDYFLVPTFYCGDEKLYEGAVEKTTIQAILDSALQE